MSNFIFVPIGSYENHGPHLPPETDYLIALKIAEELNHHFKGIIDIGIKIGHSPEHLDFESTKSLNKEEFCKKIMEKITQYSNGKHLILINTHGGNSKILKEIKNSFPNSFTLFDIFQVIKNDLKMIRTSDIGGICHAGEYETSLMLFLHPKLVKLEKIQPKNVKYVSELDPNYQGKRPREWKSSNYNNLGILGDPFKGTIEKGKKWFNIIINKITKVLEEIIS